MPQPDRFDQSGEFAASITRCLLQKAISAVESGIGALQADYSWDTFLLNNAELAGAISRAHPPPPSVANDANYKVRQNFLSQLKRFKIWLETASGKQINNLLFYCYSLPFC